LADFEERTFTQCDSASLSAVRIAIDRRRRDLGGKPWATKALGVAPNAVSGLGPCRRSHYREVPVPSNAASVEALEAKWGEKMIEVKVRFWTNDIAEEDGKIVPKHAWASGIVRMDRNRSHGIAGSEPYPFHSLLGLGAAIEKALIEQGIELHVPRQMRKYFAAEPRVASDEAESE